MEVISIGNQNLLNIYYALVKMLVTQSCQTHCNPMDCSLPGSPVHGILQARMLAWVAIPFSIGSSPPRNRTQISLNAGRFLLQEIPQMLEVYKLNT